MMIVTKLFEGSLLNEESGKTLNFEEYAFIAVPRQVKIQGWFMAFQDAFEALAKDKELWGQPQAVLNYLMSKLDFDNHIIICQADIAKALDIERTRVSESIKKLLDKGIILKGNKNGKNYTYRLNINFGYKGKAKNLVAERKNKNLRLVVNNTEK